MSNRYTVTIVPEGTQIGCRQGDNLLEVLHQGDVSVNSLCGGAGSCKRCQVMVKPPSENDGANYVTVLACQETIERDLLVKIPESALTGGHQILGVEHVSSEDSIAVDPLLRELAIDIPPPTLQDNTGDVERINRELRKHGVESAFMEHSLMRDIAVKLRENQWNVRLSYTNVARGEFALNDVEPADPRDYFGIAIDIGTTTVVVQLINLKSGYRHSVKGQYNQQSRHGADVISRINYANMSEDGGRMLHKAVTASINQLIDELVEEHGIPRSAIRLVMCAGNTTMVHLLYRLNPDYIRKDPYIPTVAAPPPLPARDLGICVHPRAYAFVFPAIGSFVGGDIVAGVLATEVHKTDALTLFIDIGTNGEIVLGNRDFLMACSASAGPAFEGGGITHGMRATKGAIEQMQISPTLEVAWKTVNNAQPVGLCGTGLIATLHSLQTAGVINRSGQFNMELAGPRLRPNKDGHEFVLVWAKDTSIGEDIVITSDDIKNLMRSKAAVYAGIRMLLKNLAFEESMIENVLIAGGFGNFLDIEAAIGIGLLPDLSRERFAFVGNSSLHGAVKSLLSREAYAESLEVASQMAYLELSSEEQATGFMDEFIAAQFIPHTDLSLFPSQQK